MKHFQNTNYQIYQEFRRTTKIKSSFHILIVEKKNAKFYDFIYVFVVKLLDDVKFKIVFKRLFKKYDSNNNKIDVFEQYYVNDK